MRKIFMLLTILIAAGILLISVDGKAESLKYINEDIGFSFEYPADYKEEPTFTGDEIARFANQNEFKIPVLTASIGSRREGTQLTDLPEIIIKILELSIPNTSDYNIIEKDSIKLSDGSDAIFFIFTWVWMDGTTVMETVDVSAYKGDKLITITGTTVQGLGFPLEQLSEYCRTLRLTPP